VSVHGIDHVGVTVPDIDAATEFFTGVLSAEVLYDTLPPDAPDKGGPGTTERLGVPPGTQQVAIRMLRLAHGPGLELFEYRFVQQREPAVASDLGWQHVAVYVDDIAAVTARIVDAGGSVLSEPQPLPGPESGPRNQQVYCRTPWGSTLELLTYPDPQPYEAHTSRRRWRP
jgi:catechol 2,3-dioxygenase-like lactoylglutathione lyase family enzyme